MAQRRARVILLLGTGAVLLAVLFAWRPWRSGAEDLSMSGDVPVGAVSNVDGSTTTDAGAGVVQLASRKGDDSGALLGLSMPAPQSSSLLPSGSNATLADDVREWMTAYGDIDSTRWVAMASKTGVVLPDQLADPKQLKYWWEGSLAALQKIRFDPTRTTSRLIPLSTLTDRLNRKCQCATRHTGRTFMQGALDAHQLGVEACFAGTFGDSTGNTRTPVELLVTFAWNPQVSKWVVVRICLVNIPMGISDDPPLL